MGIDVFDSTPLPAPCGAAKRWRCRIALGLGVLLAFPLVSATASVRPKTFFIDADSGSDSNSGRSPGRAWATIDRANAQNLEPGDRLLFKGGQVFEGTVVVDSGDAGDPSRPVVIGSFGEDRATISAGPNRGISVYNAGGVEIEHLEVVGTSYAAGGDELTNGVEFFTDLGSEAKLEHIRLDDVDVSGFRGAGVLLGAWPGDGTKSGFRDVRITHVESHDNGDAGIASYGYWDPASTTWAHENVYVGHSRVYRNRGVPGKGGHTGDGIVLGDVNNAVIEYSVAFDNGADNDHPGGGPVGIWAWDSNRVVIQFNESYANKSKTLDGDGFDLDGGVTNSVVQYNYSHDNYGPGLLIAQFPGARPFHDNVFRYNISENDARRNDYGAILFWNGGSGIRDTVVHNNTVFVTPSPGSDPAVVRFWSTTENTRFYNNIFAATGDLPLVDTAYGGDTGAVFSGNNYWLGDGNGVHVLWGSEVYRSLDEWRTATGQELDGGQPIGSAVDPRLTAPGRGGTIGDPERLSRLDAYRLHPGSPLRDAGFEPPGFTAGPIDFYGTRVPQGHALDVGAHELRRGRY